MSVYDSARREDGVLVRRSYLAVFLVAAAVPYACGKSNNDGAVATGTQATTSAGSGGAAGDAGAGASSGAGRGGSSTVGGAGTGGAGTGGAGTGGVGGRAGAGNAGNAGGGGTNAGGASTAGGAGSGGGGGGAGAGGAGQAGQGGQAGAGGAPGVDGATPMPLRIHWIDVEGGAATLIVVPTGETILVDAGWAGTRDPNRIVTVLNEVQAKQLDYMITTHYHADHVGGVAALAGLFPITRFVDHGDTVEPGATFNNYLAVANAARTVVKPGDKFTFGAVELTFVTAAGQVVDPPLAGSVPNTFCAGATMKSDVAGAENPMSVGFVLRFGKFDFVDLGDLTWNVEQKLMCPENRIGLVDLYQVSHHGMDLSSSPQLVHALAPSVVVMNNGATKGGAPAAFDVLRASPGLSDLWALHRVTANDAQHNADEALTANIATPDAAYGIKAVVLSDGAYTLTNARNGTARSYMSR